MHPFGGPVQVIEFPGRYTHKAAISNHRIAGVGADGVSFHYKGYKDGGKGKTMQLSNEEFVRRFVQHILPHRFVGIRHYGIVSGSWKRGKLQALQASPNVVRKEVPVKPLLHKCPCCKTGTLVTIEVFGSRGPPVGYLTASNTATVTA